ncbi:Clavaminate synthase-like protein [Coprinopsis marcescibilis]|uniref:Clavaminate synthase-like protein n=1 Tax=Coprinopsis marcescibilis TaxID=230819 RepID=A0A5C3L7G9_COPMA|nr:Clavaminate synthase-like protein [Coprinopsis marcescibilis]
MNSLQDPTRKTSITSLLNPSEASGFPYVHSSIPQNTIAPNRLQAHAHPGAGYSGPHANGSLFNLRAANWEPNSVANRHNAADPANHRRQGSDALTSNVGVYNQASRPVAAPMGHAPGRIESTTTLWTGSTEAPPQSLPHFSPGIAASMYPDARHGMTDGFAPQCQSDTTSSTVQGQKLTESHSKKSNQDDAYRGMDLSVSAWQVSERVSVRLAAREMVPAPQQSNRLQHETTYGSVAQQQPPTLSYPRMSPLNPSDRSMQQQPLPSLRPQPEPQQESVTGSKRLLPAGEAEASAPKPKRPAKAKPKVGQAGVPVPSKRGFNSKKRNEAAQIAEQNALATAPPDDYALVTPYSKELQFARCMSNRYKNIDFPRCVSCTRRWAGDTCRFQNIRYFVRSTASKEVMGLAFSPDALPPTVLNFPTEWNVPLQQHHVEKSKTVIAKGLLRTLKLEREHLKVDDVMTRPRESDVRVTCDTCMTSIFSSSWMCRLCGREACSDCYALIRELTEDPPHASPSEVAERQRRRDRHAHSNPFFLSCTKRNEHDTSQFTAMSRFSTKELDSTIAEMEKLWTGGCKEAGGLPDAVVNGSSPRPSTNGALTDPTPSPDPANESRPPIEVYLAYQSKSTYLSEDLAPNGSAPPQHIPLNMSIASAVVPSIEPYRYSDPEVTNFPSGEKFAKIWGHGEPVVVANILGKFKVAWSPEYFTREFGDRTCLITECEKDVNKKTVVSEFFSDFGKYEGRTEVWKLKDWPPSADFKTAFPQLYEDFSQAVPVPDYVRRDGVYNIGSHFPSNVIAPDLGPKMYNAWAANQGPGSKGSTRLHMDMADAMNVMLYASQCPDGSPGCAVWDIYRACDSEKIRNFLRSTHSLQPNYDPIHGQQYYLDDALRLKLWREYRVKSYRVYQRPGEAIFIPAGCAHQVSNMADSIKIAIDYVSPENIDRCANLTREFREQNKSKVWKEDVLQLKTMMWFAWQSCSRREVDLLVPAGSSSAAAVKRSF